MNLDMMRITEDKAEMISIAKSIVEAKKEKYNNGLMNLITESVKRRLPNANSDEIKNQVYLTIYHYWAYGTSFDEYYYNLENKTHEQKKEYMFFQVRMLYGKHLNEIEKADLLL